MQCPPHLWEEIEEEEGAAVCVCIGIVRWMEEMRADSQMEFEFGEFIQWMCQIE